MQRQEQQKSTSRGKSPEVFFFYKNQLLRAIRYPTRLRRQAVPLLSYLYPNLQAVSVPRRGTLRCAECYMIHPGGILGALGYHYKCKLINQQDALKFRILVC